MKRKHVERHCPTCECYVFYKDRVDPIMIALSKYHTRCLKCDWPVATTLLDEDGICMLCKRKEGIEL